MDSLKGIADAFEKLLYDVLGLLLPGGTILFASAAVLGDDALAEMLSFADDHMWLALGATYLAGLALQGVSRPLVNLCRLPVQALQALLPERAASWMDERLGLLTGFLHRGHRATRDDMLSGEAVDLLEVLGRYWSERLPLHEGAALSPDQVANLSFSAIVDERRQLDRFRAAASLARGVAAALVPPFFVFGTQLAVGLRPREPTAFWVLAGLAVAIYGLIERADWYAGLWRTVLHTQAAERVFRAPAPTKKPS